MSVPPRASVDLICEGAPVAVVTMMEAIERMGMRGNSIVISEIGDRGTELSIRMMMQ